MRRGNWGLLAGACSPGTSATLSLHVCLDAFEAAGVRGEIVGGIRALTPANMLLFSQIAEQTYSQARPCLTWIPAANIATLILFRGVATVHHQNGSSEKAGVFASHVGVERGNFANLGDAADGMIVPQHAPVRFRISRGRG
jgi:hypothetical protein